MAAGTEFFITPPLFDLEAMGPFLKRAEDDGIKLIPTVLLLKSLGMARYMARNVEHVSIPDELITRIQKSKDKVRGCIEIAAETIKAIRQAGFAGVQIATLGWENRLPDILSKI